MLVYKQHIKYLKNTMFLKKGSVMSVPNMWNACFSKWLHLNFQSSMLNAFTFREPKLLWNITRDIFLIHVPDWENENIKLLILYSLFAWKLHTVHS